VVVGEALSVGDGLAVGMFVGDGDGVAVEVGVRCGVTVMDAVGVGVAERARVGVGVLVLEDPPPGPEGPLLFPQDVMRAAVKHNTNIKTGKE
jgi:hypothetical protein